MPYQSKLTIFLIRCLHMMTYVRFELIRNLGWVVIKKIVKFDGQIFTPTESSVRILVGGDVSFDHEIRILPFLGVYGLKNKTGKYQILRRIKRKLMKMFCKYFFSHRIFYSLIESEYEYQELLIKNSENEKRKFVDDFYKNAIRFNIDYSFVETKYNYPFKKIKTLLKNKDLVLVNLETPLTRNSRARGYFISDPHYAQAMKDAGISIVSLANNHIFDAGEVGFLETMQQLDDSGISYTGAGRSLEEARLGKLVQLNGVKIIFLSYTQWCIHRYSSIAAEYPGILPMDRKLIIEDIKVARDKADFVFICLHWGFEDQPNVHCKQLEIAHLLIDAGADAIIGHHPHVPHGIEIYKKRPILYSLGNFIFGLASVNWINDNYLAEIVIDQRLIQGIIVYPISGRGQELFQPELLSGDRAEKMLYDLQLKSTVFKTKMAIKNSIGYINIQ